MLLFILLALFLLLILLLFSKVHISIKYDGDLFVKIRYAFLKIDLSKIKKYLKPQEKEKKKAAVSPIEKTKQSLEQIKRIIQPVLSSIKYIATKPVFDRLWIAVRFSTGDPIETAITNGIISSIIFPFVGFIDSQIKIKDRAVAVTPVFGNEEFTFFFDGILYLRMVNIIMACIIFLKGYLKGQKKSKNSAVKRDKGVVING